MVSEHRTDPLLGAVVDGRYDVRARLARGGMSTVYLAVDLRLDREVALKVLYPHLAEDAHLVERFEQEAKTAARLSHPHVVNVLDQGVDAGPEGEVAYLAMEYIPGYTLRTVLRRQHALSPRLALAYLDAIVDGLAAAHRAGLAHRDMKPENVLVSRDGQIKVADFGLARAATHHTGTGASLFGTVAYVSPELVRGSPADERTDIYAVGIMASEMLTGDQPYTGSTPLQVASQHLQERVPAPSEDVPGLAAELDELVLWCTEPDPRDRPADAGALLVEIRQLRANLSDEELDFEGATSADATGTGTAAVPGHRPEHPEAAGSDGDPTVAFSPAAGPGADGDPTVALTPGPGPGADGDATTVLPTGQDATRVLRPGADEHPTEALSRGDRHVGDLDGPEDGHHTEVFDPGKTTVLPMPAHQPGQHPAHQPGPPPDQPSGRQRTSVLLGLRSGRGSRTPSARAERRRAARAARTPTENLGRGNRTRRWVWAIVVVMLAALLLLTGWFFGSGPGAQVVVPDVTGLSASAAVDDLEAVGVGYTLVRTHHDLVAPDSVIDTDPEPGTEVRRFNTVDVLVSQGPEMFTVPDLSGRDRQGVEDVLVQSELALGETDTEYSDTVEQGQVIRQDPAPGTQMPRNHRVHVVVSDGPEPVAVPDVTGLTVPEARERLDEAGLTLETAGTENSPDVEQGRIISQDPASGEVPRGSSIRVVESLGPVMVQVPDVTGLGPGQARQQLEQAGFEVDLSETLGPLLSFGDPQVRSQSPSGGEQAPEGSTIRLVVF